MTRACLLCVLIEGAILTACTGANDASALFGDAGPDAGALGDFACDGGVCPESPEDAGVCGALVTACCGETCEESAACAAAQLVSEYEPDRCEDALADTQTFPHCELGNCDTLVEKVCGLDDLCPDAPGCAAAKELQARNADPDATQDEIAAASSACLQALEDETVFAPCP